MVFMSIRKIVGFIVFTPSSEEDDWTTDLNDITTRPKLDFEVAFSFFFF